MSVTCTYIHTHTDACRHTLSHTYTLYTYARTYGCTHTHTYRDAHTHTHSHTYRDARAHTRRNAHTHTIHAHIHSHTYMLKIKIIHLIYYVSPPLSRPLREQNNFWISGHRLAAAANLPQGDVEANSLDDASQVLPPRRAESENVRRRTQYAVIRLGLV
jgi:hypothetical protein